MFQLSRREAFLQLTAASFSTRAMIVGAAVGGVADEGFVRVGGIDQWVSVRGRNSRAPLMLYLHGGPGEAMSPFQDLLAPYEQDFLVALWDQRGAGRTYGRSGRDKTPDMTPDQFIRDGIELSELLRGRWNKRKIVLLGQSWGSAISIQMVKRRPDLFHVNVGTGQAVSREATELAQERHARGILMGSGDRAGLEALAAATRLPLSDPKRRFATRNFDIGPEDQKFLSREDKFMGPKPWPKTGEVADWIGGYSFTSDVLVPKLIAGPDVVELAGYSFKIPMITIQGRNDYICPSEVARAYVAKMRAPAKAFVELDGGHFVCLTNPQAFLESLRRHVLPHVRSA